MGAELPKNIRKRHDTHTEYSFEKAIDFYDFLLNLSDRVDPKLETDNVEMLYHPADKKQLRWIFRGHWDSSCPLLPRAFREKSKGGKEWYEGLILKPAESFETILKIRKPQVINLKKIKFKKITNKNALKYQIIIERALLEQFMDIANILGIECNYTPSLYGEEHHAILEAIENNDVEGLKQWPDRSLWPLMSSAQHHGIPTRLLDFTYNPLFAAFFAASRPFEKKLYKVSKVKKLCIWAINETATRDSTWHEIPAVKSRAGNLFAQEGVLILNPDANDTFTTTNKWQDLKTMGNPDFFIKLILPQSEYKNLLRLLWNYDITPARIRPNLDRVTQTLEYTQWLWTEK